MALFQTLTEDFDTYNSARWYLYGSTFFEGSLRMLAPSLAQIETKVNWSLTGSYAYITILDEGASHPDLIVYPLRIGGIDDVFLWSLQNGNLEAYHDSTLLFSATYDSSMARVRIRESGGTVYFDTAPVSSSWTNRASTTPAGSVSSMSLVIMNTWDGASAFANTVIFDDLNLGPGELFRSISGSLIFSGVVARPEAERYRTISGGLIFGGRVTGTKQLTFTDVERKSYLYKVYTEDDDFLGVWSDVINEFRLPEELNTAGSAVTVELARNSDSLITSIEPLLDNLTSPILDSSSQAISTSVQSPNQIGEGSNVDYNHRVDVYVFYGYSDALLDSDGIEILDSNFEAILGTMGAPNGARVYSGFISDISSRYGSTETTVVTLMSFGWDLDQYPVSSGSNTTVTFSSTDPSNMVRNGLDAFQAASGSGISYNASTILSTGTTTSYTFKANTYLELLKKGVELAPSDWFYFLDQGAQLINFREQSVTPDHYFHLGKHIEDLDLRGNIENVINDVLFIGAESAGVALYDRTTVAPSPKTRRGLKRLSDSRVSLLATSTLLSTSEIDRNNLVLYRSTVKILDKVYDIESIRLGQKVGFRNFGNYIDELELQIVGRVYTPESVELQLGSLLPRITKRVQDIKRSLEAQESEMVPVAPS